MADEADHPADGSHARPWSSSGLRPVVPSIHLDLLPDGGDADIALAGDSGDAETTGQELSAKKRKRCRFFNTKKGCKAGDECPFLHEASKPHQENVKQAQPKDQDQKNEISKIDAPSSNASASASTSRAHSRPTKGQLLARPKAIARPNPPAAQKDPRAFQIAQIKTRFNAREEKAREATILLHFNMAPSDPDFPFEIDSLKCTLTLPVLWPHYKPPALRVTNKEMERGYQVNVEKGFDVIWSQASAPTLLGAMKALDKQLEALLMGKKAEIVKLIANADRRHIQPAASHMEPVIKEDAHIAQQRVPASAPAPVPAPPVPPAPIQYTPELKQEAQARREQETRQLEHRFSRVPGFVKVGSNIYTIPIVPRKHESLPQSLRSVKNVLLLVPDLYNLEPCTIELQGVRGDAAQTVEKAFLRRSIEMSGTSLFAQINYVAANMHAMAAETPAPVPKVQRPTLEVPVTPAPQSEKVVDTEKSHVKIIARPPEWGQAQDDDADSTDGYESDYTDSDEDLHDSKDRDQDQDLTAERNKPQYSGPTTEHGTMLSFPSLELHGIELLELARINLSVKCERCRDTTEIKNLRPKPSDTSSTDYAGLRSESCRKCVLPFSIGYRADMMHASGVRAGYLDLDGCSAFDLLLSTFVPTCSECSTPYTQGVPSVRGDASMALCRECHKKMSFKLNDVKFLAVSASTHLPSAGLPRRKPKESLGITAGESLPRRGRCTHYAKSHRWFRFSCCGKVFPCDKCHDGDPEVDHPNEFANRMICGYCAREQIYRPEDCGICRAKLTGRTGSGFWEGGKGTRDRKRMSRKDPRKYKRRGGGALGNKNKEIG